MDIENWLKNKRTMYLEQSFNKDANKAGFRTDRKIVVIESDDWGSIRMHSKKVRDELCMRDPMILKHPFFRYDALEGSKDMENLFEVLGKWTDKNGNHPVITANCAVANPDFDAIRKSNFTKYVYEPFTQTMENTSGCEKAFSRWQEGIRERLFYPQLHCREHFNVKRWMHALQNGDELVHLAFEHNMISTASCKNKENENSYMDSFNYDNAQEIDDLKKILAEGARLFEDILGYQSKSFIASCYIWGNELEDCMNTAGIRYIQGEPYQRIPTTAAGTTNLLKKRHYLGDKNQNGQMYLVRNTNFEPSWNPNKDWVNIAINGIQNAFKNKKPAIICSHRLNYIGRIDEDNRDRNLKSLGELLMNIMKTWPDVEFMTSVQLGEYIDSMEG